MTDISSIPFEVKDKIMDEFSSLPLSTVTSIKNKNVENVQEVINVICDYYAPNKATYFYDELIPIFEKNDIVCFHSSRLSSRDYVLKYGLKTNDWNTYSSNLIESYMRTGIASDKIDEAVKIVKHEYERKNHSISGDTQLSFFSNLSLIKGEYSQYAQYCKNVGGELARWALEEGYPELYNPLKESGEGVVIKFKLPFSNIANYCKDNIVFVFVAYYAGVYFWNKKFNIEFDGTTQFNIPPKDIIEVIEFNQEIDY